METASPPGYSSVRKKVLIHSLAFGTIFEPAAMSPLKDQALPILQEVAFRGKTLVQADGVTPATSASTPLHDQNRIIGDVDTRVNKLQAAFKRIMQDGVQVTLLE
jgi:hypothetical protein